jgi:hypothetical protein
MAGGVVDDRQPLDLSCRFAVDAECAVRSDARLLMRPHPLAAMSAEGLDAVALLEPHVEQDPGVAHHKPSG